MQNNTSTLDPQVVALAQSIRTAESNNNFTQKGASGEMGAYQWMPATWSAHAKDVLGDPNAPMTPSNQNAVAYATIKQWKDQGLNPAQIAAKWNSGSEVGWENKIGTNSMGVAYNVPAYVKKVVDLYQQNRPQGGVSNPLGLPTADASTGDQSAQQSGGPAFAYNPSDSALVSGLKAVGNLPGSAVGFGVNAAQQFNPIQALNNVGQIGSGFSDLASQEGYGKAFLDVLKGIPKAAYDTLVPSGVRSLISGDTQGAAKAFTEDPFGQAAPLVLAAEGGAKLADRIGGTTPEGMLAQGAPITVDPQGVASLPQGKYAGAFDNAVSSVGGAAANVLGKAVGAPLGLAGGAVSGLTRSLASHLTGLDPQTITQVISNPEDFAKVAMDQMDRGSIFDSVKQGLETLQNSYGENGKLYQAARAGAETITVPEDFIKNVLDKYGFKLTGGPDALANGEPISVKPNGVASLPDTSFKVEADTNSATRNPSDINAIQNFVDNWSHKQTLTPNEFLNMRSDLAQMAKYGKEIGRNDVAERVANDLRVEANKAMRPQVPGLKVLDEQTAPQIELLKRVKKDLMNADGTFKDNAATKIANSLNKEGLLSRLEKLQPGITKQLQVLKAVEDIERAQGIKVGSYTKGIIGGIAITGNVAAIAAAIISNPAIAVPLIRGLGWSAERVVPLLRVLRTVAGDVATKANSTPSSVLAAGVVQNPDKNK